MLDAKQTAFVRMMQLSDEHARRGFELLLKRSDFPIFFDELNEKGLFNADHNISPIQVEDGLYRVPFWDALNYLTETARVSGTSNDVALAQKVMSIVRNVSEQRGLDGKAPDNYHTYSKFAQIIGLVPASVVDTADFSFIPTWLSSNFDRGLVIHALDVTLKSFLESEEEESLHKACEILDQITGAFLKDSEGKKNRYAQSSENHWLKQLFDHHAAAFGQKSPVLCIEILIRRIKEISGEDSSFWRAAIEDHPQNFSNNTSDIFVNGLRDMLLAWTDCDSKTALLFIENLISNEIGILRRIGIYVLSERWSALRDIYIRVVGPGLFNSEHLHELYNLLKEHFSTFNEAEKNATIAAISAIPQEAERLYKRVQRNWLSSIAGNGYQPADDWYAELLKDSSLGPPSDFPSLHYFSESWSGPGPSPYTPLELIAFAKSGNIVERLNEYQPIETWKGPNKRALSDVLENAVFSDPDVFSKILPQFLKADRPYQYAIIEGLRRAWEANDNSQTTDWETIWPTLMDFFHRLLSEETFWTEEIPNAETVSLIPTREWIPPVIANTLRAGTRDDGHAYSESLLNIGLDNILLLLQNLKGDDGTDSSDAMGRAINTSRGKAIESLMSHALRICRVSDANLGDHVNAWVKIQPIFDSEIFECRNSNFEFSTLAASYIANLDYMNPTWLELNFPKIFTKEYPKNFSCAIGGLAYAQATQNIHRMLVENGIFDYAFENKLATGSTRERLVERIVLGYLWESEKEHSKPLEILNARHYEEKDVITATSFLWTLRGQTLSPMQRTRIIKFLTDAIEWEQSRFVRSPNLLSTLSLLTSYMVDLGAPEIKALEAVAPHTHVAYNTDFFIEELDRLAEKYPEEVCSVLSQMLSIQIPFFDFEDRLKKLLRKLFSSQRVSVLGILEKLSRMDGMTDLYKELELHG